MNKSILIIDDDPLQRKTLASILEGRGYKALAAKDGTEGLTAVDANKIDLALIDLGLPDMSGMTVLERIKAEHPATEAIILTGNATLDSAIEATNRGAFSYLVKPYKIDQLLLQIKRANEKREAEEKIVRHAQELERINAELKALYAMSLTMSRTIEVDELLSEVLEALVQVDIFPFERRAAAFVVEGDHLRLVSWVGLSRADIESCRDFPIGDCICGRAISSGELVIAGGSEVCHAGMEPHGNIALPLKIMKDVIGVISLKTRPDIELSDETVRLLTSLGNQISIAVNNAKLYDEARRFSLRDHLTGLANRRFLNMQLGKSLEAAKRYRERLSLIMLDIDHFKAFNDRLGHVQGDRLLVRLAAILIEEMRTSDYVFRYGGEEFLVILPQTDLATACDAAERLRKSVEASAGVTISLGVSTYRESMQEGEELIKAADVALYQAKQGGRNMVVASP